MSLLEMTVIGYLGRDAQIRDTGDKYAINFSVAHNEKYVNQNNQEVDKTTWVNCTIWRTKSQGSKIADLLRKGAQIYASGTPSTRAYESNGEWKSSQDLRVNKFRLLSSHPDQIKTQSQNNNTSSQEKKNDDYEPDWNNKNDAKPEENENNNQTSEEFDDLPF